jgi:hypothetical protein
MSERGRPVRLHRTDRARTMRPTPTQELGKRPLGLHAFGRDVDAGLYHLLGQVRLDSRGDQITLDSVSAVAATLEAVTNESLGELLVVEHAQLDHARNRRRSGIRTEFVPELLLEPRDRVRPTGQQRQTGAHRFGARFVVPDDGRRARLGPACLCVGTDVTNGAMAAPAATWQRALSSQLWPFPLRR